MGFLNRSRQARKKAGLTLRKAAEELKLQPQYVCMIEGGKRSPSLETLSRMCKVYDCDPNRIFPYEPEEFHE